VNPTRQPALFTLFSWWARGPTFSLVNLLTFVAACAARAVILFLFRVPPNGRGSLTPLFFFFFFVFFFFFAPASLPPLLTI